MNHETHIQPKQAKKSSQIRIPSADENCRGPQGHPPTQKSGQKRTCRLRKSDRLKKRFEFQNVMKQGDRLIGRFLCVDRKKGSRLRFGISASKRYGNSPERNRFKRLIREAFRTSRHALPQDIELNFVPRAQAKTAKIADIQKELLKLLT
jgi:ribonuclease P protein component